MVRPASPPAEPRTPLRRSAGVIVAACLAMLALSLTLLAAVADAQPAGSAWWYLDSTYAANPQQSGEGQLLVTATNLGDAPLTTTGASPVTLIDRLPPGVSAVSVDTSTGEYPGGQGSTELAGCTIASATVSCPFTGTLPPGGRLLIRLTVNTPTTAATGTLVNTIEVAGGNAPSRTTAKALPAIGPTAAFGLESLAMTPEGPAGEEDTLAGSHPFQLTTTVDFDQTLRDYSTCCERGLFPSSAALPRRLHFTLPAGLVGNVTQLPQCSEADFFAIGEGGLDPIDLCPDDTTVGTASVVVNIPEPAGFETYTVPVFNLTPGVGEPARFGFEVQNVPVVLHTALPTGGDYAVQVSISEISQAAQVLSSVVTFWGDPSDERHDASRGWNCVAEGRWLLEEARTEHPCPTSGSGEPATPPLLTLPTSCQSPPQTSVTGESWPAGTIPSQQLQGPNSTFTFPAALSGCETLTLDPSFTTGLETPLASTPTGITGTLTLPQPGLSEPEGRAETALSNVTLLLPEGLQVNPSAANGLQACTELEAGYQDQNPQTGTYEYTPSEPECPDASKVATVHANTPLLGEELSGALYLAEPAPNGEPGRNPFGSLVALYMVLQAPRRGVLVKLAADIRLNEQTGREEGVFPGAPQLPVHELTLSFFGGPRAATASPAFCGAYQLTGQFTGWSGTSDETLSAPPFQITAGPEGAACPEGHLPFAPSFTAGPASPQAGALTPVIVKIGRPDGNQALNGISVTEPPGFAAILASVTPCPEPSLGGEWACGPESLIGQAREYAGLGPDPVIVTGQAYLTTGYDGAPFGLLVRTLAQAGPFNLGWVNVRSRINVNPSTAQVTVTTDPGPRGEQVPTLLKGVPVQLKALEVAVNRPGFTFNPTSCAPSSFTGTLTGSEGATLPVSSSFVTAGCAGLPFHPILEASTRGQASKQDGTSLTVKVTSQGLGVANIQKVDLQLPKQLPSRLTTIQKACLAAVFEANPAACDEGSVIGAATIHTPVFKNPLTGPAYLVSHGNAAFPDVEFVLQGEGVEIVLDGHTDIKNGITYSKFETAPDAPFTTFETVLPAGPHSALSANVPEKDKYNLCGQSLSMPTVITAQNGTVIEQSTNVQIEGCAQVKSVRVKKLTLAQQLAKALATCRSTHKHSKAKRVACERRAHATYTAKAIAACRNSDKHSVKKRKACEATARRRYGAKAARNHKA